MSRNRAQTIPGAAPALFSFLAVAVVAFSAGSAVAGGNPAATPVERTKKEAVARHKAILERVKHGDVDLVFLGDSITEHWGTAGLAIFKSHYEPLKAANLGVGADSTQHALWRITKGGELKPIQPKVVVLMMGINNVNNGNTPDQISGGIAALIKAIQDHNASTRVLLLGTFPAGKEPTSKFRAPVKALNLLLAKQASGDKVRFLDISAKFLDAGGHLTDAHATDHIHLTAKGYKIWAEAIDPTLRAMMGGASPKPPTPKPPTPIKGDRTHWIYSDGDLIETSPKVWVERQKTGEFHFVETARTPEFVELFDKSRDYTVRLTATAMLIKGGNAAAVVKFADFTKQRDGHFADTAPVVVGGPRRLQWKYDSGFVQYDYSHKWTEKNGEGTFHFVEKGRTADHIELFDKTRDYTVRLTDTALLIKGGNDKFEKFADFTSIRTGKWVAEFPVIELGKLSEKFESGGRGPGTVSSGVDDPGGVSYGTYQLSSTRGRADAFVKRFYPSEFKGLKAGTAEFTKKWRELAKKDPGGLHANEHAFIKETHHDIQVAKIAKETGLVVGTRSRVVQDAVWSIAVQHGPSTSMVVTALKPLLKAKTADKLSDEELIRAIYTERSKKNAAGKLFYAATLKDSVQASLAARWVSERREALDALEAK